MSEDKSGKTSVVAPTAEPQVLRPTVLPTQGARPRRRPRAGALPTSAPGAAQPAAPPIGKPTAMPGVERRRIEVDTGDLNVLSPGAAPEVYKRAVQLIGIFAVTKTTERKVILWGHDLQQAYSDLVTGTLALSQTPLLRKVDGYLTRMMEILGSIDLMAVCGQGPGPFRKLLESVNKKIDTVEELEAAQAELDQIVSHLGVALDDLLDLKDQLEQHASKVIALGTEVEAAALAALYLSSHVPKERRGLGQRLTERSMSLTQTLAQIRSGDSLREMQIDHPIRMVRAVQDVALVMMPGLLGSIASTLTLIRRKRLTPTQADELTYQLRDIVQRLPT